MTLSITHTKVSGIADVGDATLIEPSDWNAAHTFVGGTPGSILFINGSGALAQMTGPQVKPIAICATGDSITQGSVNGNTFFNLMTLLRPGFLNKGNFGVFGETSAQILARLGADVLVSGATTCVVQCGINDIATSVPEATLRANCIAIWTTLMNAGITPVDVALCPNNTPANVPRIVAHNVWRTLYCRRHGIAHVDTWDVLASSTGAYASGLSGDGLHPNTVGATAMANAVFAAMFSASYQAGPLLAYTDTGSDAGNGSYIDNAISFTGGPPPTSWNALGSGGSYSVTAPAAGEFGSWLRCTMTAGSSVGFNPTAQSLSTLGWSIGDTIALGYRLRWVDASQSMTLTTQYIGFTPSAPNGFSAQPMFQNKGGTTGQSLTVYHECTISAGTVILPEWFSDGTGYFEVSRPINVNLTLMGL